MKGQTVGSGMEPSRFAERRNSSRSSRRWVFIHDIQTRARWVRPAI